MLKQSASTILASLRGSISRNARLAFSLAATLLDVLFEHPAGMLSNPATHMAVEALACQNNFPEVALDEPTEQDGGIIPSFRGLLYGREEEIAHLCTV